MAGGLRVRLSVTCTASGLAAPPYVAGSGLTDSKLSPEECPGGILAAEIPNLCKGGDDLFNNGSGWLVFLWADKKEKKSSDAESEQKVLEAVSWIQHVGRKQTAWVSSVGFLLEGYNLCSKSNKENLPSHSNKGNRKSESMRNIKGFVTKYDQGVLRYEEAGMKEVIQLGIEGEDDRWSTRIANNVLPEKTDISVGSKEFNGKPPTGTKMWSKDALIATIVKLEETITEDGIRGTKGAMTRNRFINNVINAGKSAYQHRSGLNKMCNGWRTRCIELVVVLLS